MRKMARERRANAAKSKRRSGAESENENARPHLLVRDGGNTTTMLMALDC